MSRRGLRRLAVSVLAGALLLNVIQFVRIDRSLGNNDVLRAVYRNPSADVVHLLDAQGNVRAVHDMYVALADYAPGALLVGNARSPFGDALSLRRGSDFGALALGLGRARAVRITRTRQPIDHNAVVARLGAYDVAHGIAWLTPRAPRMGRPGITWHLFVSGRSRPTLVVTDDAATRERLLVDLALLGKP